MTFLIACLTLGVTLCDMSAKGLWDIPEFVVHMQGSDLKSLSNSSQRRHAGVVSTKRKKKFKGGSPVGRPTQEETTDKINHFGMM